MNVQLFVPCFVDQFFPETAFNMVRVLEKAGCLVSYNPEQTCCGQPAFNAGYMPACSTVAKKFMADFNTQDFIVAPSGSCVGFVRNYYHKLFASEHGALSDQIDMLPIQKQVYEFSEFLVDVVGVTNLGAVFEGVGTYHDGCAALRECHIKDAPRKLLAAVKGLDLREAPDCEVCCGFGGTFAVKYESISIGMGEQKVLNAVAMGADYMISSDLSCLMHLEGYIKKHHCQLKTLHIADVLAAGWKTS